MSNIKRQVPKLWSLLLTLVISIIFFILIIFIGTPGHKDQDTTQAQRHIRITKLECYPHKDSLNHYNTELRIEGNATRSLREPLLWRNTMGRYKKARIWYIDEKVEINEETEIELRKIGTGAVITSTKIDCCLNNSEACGTNRRKELKGQWATYRIYWEEVQ